MSDPLITGLHHITAVCGDPQTNLDFYVGVLGLRLVKKTVNFDDPATYHLYYGDGAGTPGTILTFFPWEGQPPGRDGTGQVSAVSFATDEAGLEWWTSRLAQRKIAFRGPMKRFDETFIVFEDPDGLPLEIVAGPETPAVQNWDKSPVPAQYSLHGFHSVTLTEAGYELTHALLTTQMGFSQVANEGSRFRYKAPGGRAASFIDVVCQPGGRHGLPGNGTVHHIAFRVDNDDAQRFWREKLSKLGYNVSPIMDRSYFHSIYYREPGGILFEIATDNPGFATDEPAESLGMALKLPNQYESLRSKIERHLRPLVAPREYARPE
jgi:glyoxalase family protein